MVEVYPFKGIRYNTKKIKNLDKVMSPPYDIISEEMQEKLYDKHQFNFVRLILGKEFLSDSVDNNRYLRARKEFDSWLKKSILIRSDRTAIYPYKITYTQNKRHKTMNGFFILLKLDPEYNQVKAHERTLSKPKKDRLNLLRACEANLEPIQLLYIDKKDIIKNKIDNLLSSSIIEVTGYDGFTHKLWKITDEKLISFIQNQLKDKILFIADGHHRYQTAINYADEMKEKTEDLDNNAPFHYRMVILANMFDEGLNILPTHRLISKKDVDIENTLKKLESYFNIEKRQVKQDINSEILSKKLMKEIRNDSEHKFVWYIKDRYYILTLKDEKIMDNFVDNKSKTWKTLDVSILHKIILENALGINKNNLEDHVTYTRETEEAIDFVNENKYDFSFLMNATKIEQLKAIADGGEHMPQKSTYFLPKMLSGLVMHKLD